MVALVHDHMTEVRGAEASDQITGRHTLDAGEEVVVSLWLRTIDEKLAEAAILKCVPERVARLQEYLLAMRQEQKARSYTGRRGSTSVVACGDDRLARAGGCDDEVAVAAVDHAFDPQALE